MRAVPGQAIDTAVREGPYVGGEVIEVDDDRFHQVELGLSVSDGTIADPSRTRNREIAESAAGPKTGTGYQRRSGGNG
ncbi:hypothetical protein [Saccharopolyspora spinosa]|uniref:hypothetical protein n=1 Tax=Saccharopolyspora spinosa TaxID=60894 RepID=UPI0014767350|nr:hypothetical protein [Saccharopolyspora spinosa]